MARVTGIDHVILTVRDLSAASALCLDAQGLHVSGGGAHPQFGTENRIIMLEDEYIELLATQSGRRPAGIVAGLFERGDGAMACILAADSPGDFADHLRLQGSGVDGPTQGRLVAADFSRTWTTIALRDGSEIPGFPFFIKHDTAGSERRRLLGGAVGLAAHRLGARRIASVTIAAGDSDASAEQSRHVLDLAAAERGSDSMLAARTASLSLPSGAQLVFASPAVAGRGPIAAELDARGEGMFAICLAVDDLASAVEQLRSRGIGVRVDEPDGLLVSAQLNHRATLGARIGLISA